MREQLARRLNGVYAIVNENGDATIGIAQAALEAGVRIVQYRAKDGIVPARAQVLREITRAHDALFILNDAWRDVSRYDADGVHVGPQDARLDDLNEVRAAVGDRLVGVSTGSDQEAGLAARADVDYVGVGPVFATATKSDAGVPIGIDGFSRIATIARHPAAAIGGIGDADVRALRDAGAAMVAIISALASASDPFEAARALVRAWDE